MRFPLHQVHRKVTHLWILQENSTSGEYTPSSPTSPFGPGGPGLPWTPLLPGKPGASRMEK